MPPVVIHSLLQCVSCNPINGAWYTRQEYVTRGFCEQIGGSTSVIQPDRSDANDLTLCGNILTAPNCSQYYGFTRPGAEIVVTKPWVTLGGTVEVNACNIRESNFRESIPVYYDSTAILRSSCEAFGALHPELNLCVTMVNMYAGTPVNNNTTLTEGYTSTTSPAPSSTIPYTTIAIGTGAAAAIYNYFNGGPPNQPPNTPPKPPVLVGITESAAAAAKIKLSEVLLAAGIGVGVTMAIIAVGATAPAVGLAAVGTFLVVVYNEDGTTASSFAVEMEL